MLVERAWSSEDDTILIYLVNDCGILYAVNENGNVREIHKQGIDLTLALHKLHDNFQDAGTSVFEIPVFEKGKTININTTSHNGSLKTFICRVLYTLLNRSGNVHGIEQLVVAEFTSEKSGPNIIEEPFPIILRNANKLVGLVQGWTLKAEVEDKNALTISGEIKTDCDM